MNGRSFFKLINLTFEWYIKENLRIHHDNNLLKNMVLKFEFELFILDDFRKVSKSKIGVPLRVPFWAGVRIITIANASQLTTLIKVDLNINRR